jgi:N6-L-threonylcarbamoyladenine synthase
VSGGVASNEYVKRGLELVCQEMNYKLNCPEKKLCTDNGVMIAWNGVEKWRTGIDIIPYTELDSVDIEPK